MKNNSNSTHRILIAALALSLSSGLLAQNSKDGYVQDARGVIVRNTNFGDPRIGNLCWRTGYWTPQMANCECDEAIVGRNICNPPPPIPVAQVTPPAPPPPKPAPPPPPPATATRATFAMDAFFDFDKSVLKPEARVKLDDLAVSIKGINLDVVIAVGHTDSIGNNEYNQKLSIRRSEAVKAYLVGKGIDGNRIQAGGKGETAPVADNLAAEGRARNRRVEIEVVGTRMK